MFKHISMKTFFLILLSFYSFTVICQTKEISFEGKLLVGKLKNNGNPKLLLNKKDFINALNREHYENEKILDKVKIIQAYMIGGKKSKYYYVEFSSSKRKDLHIVRWLCNYEGELYFDKSNNSEKYTYKDLFVACEGNEKCRPRLFDLGNDFGWSCREFIGCVIEEEAKVNKCSQSNIILYN
jgi:hypothetical protein